MNSGLKNIVINHWTADDSQEYNYVSLYSPNKRINLPNEKIPNFILKYCDLLYSGENIRDLNIAERRLNDMPFVVSGQFKMTKEHQWSDVIVNNIVFCFQKAILEYYNIDDEAKLYTVFLTASQPVKMADHYIYKFMIYMPLCVCKASEQVGAIEIAENKLREINVIGKFTQQPRNDWDTILNKNTANEDLVMYGSVKHNGDMPLDDFRIFGKLESEDDDTKDMILADVFEPQNHSLFQKHIISEMELQDTPDLEFWLPLFFSSGYCTKITNKRIVKTTESVKKYSDKDEMHLVFLSMIPAEKYTERYIYLDVGKVLYNIYGGSHVGLELWIQHAKMAPGTEADHERLYYTFGIKNHLTEKTLAWYARQFNREEYDHWHYSVFWSPSLTGCATGTHTDVAECFYRMYWLEFACSRVKKNIWYQYNGTRWKLMDGEVFVSKHISHQFVCQIEMAIKRIDERHRNSENEYEQKRLEDLMNCLRKVCVKLKTYTYKTQLKKELVDYFYCENFEDLLDENDNLLGLPTNILEIIEDKSYVIRPGKPEDYVSRATLVDYNDRYHINHPHIKKCDYFLRQINTDPETYQCYLNYLSSLLKGGNGDKSFYIVSGKKHNSKSQQKKLLEMIFGPQYSATIPPEAFTTKRQSSSAASPEIAQACKTRVVFSQEPNNDSTFSDSLIKIVSGGDSFFARALHDNGGLSRATFKLTLYCNDIPAFPYLDEATKDRVYIFPMLSTWVPNPPETEDEQFRQRLFKMDPNFESRLAEYAAPLLWLMVNNLNNYLNGKPRVPKSALVRKILNEYWEETDLYQKFINARLKKTDDKTMAVSFNEIQKEFGSWFKDTMMMRVPKSTTVKKEFVQRLGELKQDGSVWPGWYFIAD